MFRRFTAVVFCLCTVVTSPAAGVSLPLLADAPLETAAGLMTKRDYRGAGEAAKNARTGGARDFVGGMAAFKGGAWEEAAASLATAAETFPLLADYALASQAEALYHLGRFADALPPLERLLNRYPDSPLVRSASLLLADTLNDKGDFPAAIATYQKFIERYPAGNDALTALYKSALCRDLAGESTTAAISLRQIWLSNPASPLAGKAEAVLQTIAARGGKVPPYSAEELYRRAVSLYDLKKYPQAAAAFRGVPLEGQNEDFKGRLLLKTGQALLKARQYREAEQAFARLLEMKARKGLMEEGSYWLAKALDKNGKDDAAFTAYLRLVDAAPTSDMADDALMEAALIRKWQKKGKEAIPLLKRLVQEYPRSDQRTAAEWEIAWLSYQAGDKATAATSLKKLTEVESTREKALYWYGKVLAAAGDAAGAAAADNLLLADYPLGFYALTYRQQAQLPLELPGPIPADPRQLLPMPEGFERVKALISFGLTDEARKELGASRKKSVPASILARLYLEMADYNAAYNILRQEHGTGAKGAAYALAISYPLAFREAVSRNAASCSIDENLVYAVIRAESSFSPTALSPVGAIGLMQLMPATAAKVLGSTNDKECRERLVVPADNITAGTKHLKDLIASYKGNMVAVIAAYNAGSGNVNRWLKSFGNLPREEFIETIPYGETREYVKKVLAAADIYGRIYRLGSAKTTPAADEAGPVVAAEPVTVEAKTKPVAAEPGQASAAPEQKELPPSPETVAIPVI